MQPDTTIFVCISCRRRLGPDSETFEEPGRTFAATLRANAPPAIAVTPVECLAVCKRPCTVALAAAGKWTYIIGDLDPDTHTSEVLAAALSFGATENGIVPWKERPAAFRKGVVARVPPLSFRFPGDAI
ncbi:MAG: DUF1636 family protein [Hyphomicrobiaceae bacterium]